MADGASAEREVPDGAAVLPLIPEELGIHPLFLATLHAIIFVDSSDKSVINERAAEEVLEYIATYLQRLQGADLRRIREDVETLLAHAREEKWPAGVIEFFRSFLQDYGIGAEVTT